jgi:hypothetical protein
MIIANVKAPMVHTNFLLHVTTLLSILSMQGMDPTSLYELRRTGKEIVLSESEKHAQEATKYNQYQLFPDDIFKTIFSYYQKEGDATFVPLSQQHEYTGEVKTALLTHIQIQTLLILNRTCKRFNQLVSLKEIVAFCRALSDVTKNNTLKITIPNINKNYDPNPNKWKHVFFYENNDHLKYTHPVHWIPKLIDNHYSNCICSILMQVGANPNTTYKLVNERRFENLDLSIMSQAIDHAPFLVEVALKMGVDPNAKDKNGVPFFFYAKTIDTIQLLLTHKCRIHEKNKNRNNVMWYIINPEYPSGLLTFYLDNNVKIEGERLMANLIKCLSNYIDDNLFNEFLEKSEILLKHFDKNKIKRPDVLENLIDGFNFIVLTRFTDKNRMHATINPAKFKQKAIALYKRYGCT